MTEKTGDISSNQGSFKAKSYFEDYLSCGLGKKKKDTDYIWL